MVALTAFLPPLVLIFIHQPHISTSVQFSVISPKDGVVTMVGSDAVLPCHLSPAMSVENMEIRFYLVSYHPFVHLYEKKEDVFTEQMQQYRQRTQLQKDNLSNGSTALILHNVQPSDIGRYKCLFQSDSYYDEAYVDLYVTALGSAHQITIENDKDHGIMIVCESHGWYPQPEVMWRSSSGNISALSEIVKPTPENGLFHVKTAINAVPKLSFSCSIRNPLLKQGMESSIYISETFYNRVDRCAVSRITVPVAIFTVCAVVCYFYLKIKKCQEAKLKEKNETLAADNGRLLAEKSNLRQESNCIKVSVTFDPETAHPELIVSDDKKCVRRKDTTESLPETLQDLLNTPKRFDTSHCVLGNESFTGGRCYWEVEIKIGRGCVLGVAKDSAKRKGKIKTDPLMGIWAVRISKDELTGPTSSDNSAKPKIRVSLDYDNGILSVCHAVTLEPIHTHSSIYFCNLKVFPYFHILCGTEIILK
ncbi:butyrophilin subfamily 2 member A1-like [Discoglossus pictus]